MAQVLERLLIEVLFGHGPTGAVARGDTVEDAAQDSGFSDRGGAGVKLELSHDGDIGAAVMLPPETVQELGRWLLRTLGQDEHGFPVELGGILERLSKEKKASAILQRGDKTRIREALQALKS